MKLNATPEQCRAIAEMIRKALHVSLFTQKSCTPKYDAQQNLAGRTHYVDDSTLRFHFGRVLSAGQIGNSWGLLYRITESVALDMHNRERGTRCVVFDLFGTTVYHPKLEETFSNSKKAEKDCSATEFDIVAHYREALESRLRHAEQEAASLRDIVQQVAAMQPAEAAAAPAQA